MSDRPQLLALSKPFKPALIHEAPSGHGSFVSHDVVTQKLLAVLGPFSFEIRPLTGTDPKGNGQVVVAVIGRLTVEIDGRQVVVEEAGDAIGGGNWKHDGERLKDGASDALKRCAMRLGVALHLWSGGEFFLHQFLSEEAESA